MEVALKLISGQFNPIQLNFSRFLVGGLVLIPFAVRELKKRGRKLDGKALGSFALLGLMGIAVSMSLYQLSVTRIQASVVGVLFSSNPVFVTLFAFLLLHETISKNQIAGLVLDVAGIVLDPFAGSGSTAVTAKKLGRRFVAIERSEQYCAWAEKRLELA